MIRIRSEDPFLDDCVLMGRTFLIFGTCLLALGAGLLLGGVSDVGLVAALAFAFAGGSMVAISLGIAWWVRRREARTMRTRGNVVADLVVYACPKCRCEYRDAADMFACPCAKLPRVKTGVREGAYPDVGVCPKCGETTWSLEETITHRCRKEVTDEDDG